MEVDTQGPQDARGRDRSETSGPAARIKMLPHRRGVQQAREEVEELQEQLKLIRKILEEMASSYPGK